MNTVKRPLIIYSALVTQVLLGLVIIRLITIHMGAEELSLWYLSTSLVSISEFIDVGIIRLVPYILKQSKGDDIGFIQGNIMYSIIVMSILIFFYSLYTENTSLGVYTIFYAVTVFVFKYLESSSIYYGQFIALKKLFIFKNITNILAVYFSGNVLTILLTISIVNTIFVIIYLSKYAQINWQFSLPIEIHKYWRKRVQKFLYLLSSFIFFRFVVFLYDLKGLPLDRIGYMTQFIILISVFSSTYFASFQDKYLTDLNDSNNIGNKRSVFSKNITSLGLCTLGTTFFVSDLGQFIFVKFIRYDVNLTPLESGLFVLSSLSLVLSLNILLYWTLKGDVKFGSISIISAGIYGLVGWQLFDSVAEILPFLGFLSFPIVILVTKWRNRYVWF